MKKNNIILIGFMGVGKGRLARALAAETGFFALDTDDLLESFENRKIKKIFRQEGEPYFRNLEKRVAHWLEIHVSSSIISTGGGFFAVENLNRIGTVIFLKADFETILQEIFEHPKAAKKIKKRPLLQDTEKARALFDARQPLYADKADMVIDVTGRPSQDIASEIINHLKFAPLAEA